MDFFGIFLGWNWKLKRTRRRWDRLRERSLDKKGSLREKLLYDLDKIEERLKTVEEEQLSRRDRTKILREIEMELANISDLVNEGEDWLPGNQNQGTSR